MQKTRKLVLISLLLGFWVFLPIEAQAFEATKLSSIINSSLDIERINSGYALLEYQQFKEILPPACEVNNDDDAFNDTSYECRPYLTIENKKIYIKLSGSIDSNSVINLKGSSEEDGLKKIHLKMQYDDLIKDSKHDVHCLIQTSEFQKKVTLPVNSLSLSRISIEKNKESFIQSLTKSSRKIEIKASQPYLLAKKALDNKKEIRNVRLRLGFKL